MSVRLIQMKWNGIVSQLGQSAIARRFARANANHATSIALRRKAPLATPTIEAGRALPARPSDAPCWGPALMPSLSSGDESIAAMPDRFDRVRAELLAQPPDAHLDDVRARVEVVAPDVREQPLAAHDLALVQNEVVQQPELAVGQGRDHIAELRLPPRDVEGQRPRTHDAAVLARPPTPQLGPHAGQQLVERERLREVIAGAEVEPAQLRLELRAGRDDDHR